MSNDEQITFVKTLGKGGFGETYLYQKNNNDYIVIKQMKYSKPSNRTRWLRIINSEKNAFNLDHPNIVTTQWMHWQDENTIHIYMDFGGSTNLFHIIETKDSVETLFKIHCIKSIISGLKYLHQNNILHLDLKPSNILYCDLNNTWKISDFGASINLSNNNNSLEPISPTSPTQMFISYTIPFCSPEIFKEFSPSVKMDIYSFGCVLWCLFEWSNILYPNNELEEIIYSVSITNNRPQFKHASIREQDLCQILWCQDPDKRPTSEILEKMIYGIYFQNNIK